MTENKKHKEYADVLAMVKSDLEKAMPLDWFKGEVYRDQLLHDKNLEVIADTLTKTYSMLDKYYVGTDIEFA